MNRILLLEDAFDRILWFRKTYHDYKLDITRKPTQAIYWLQKHVYSYVFLDHDLQDEHYEVMIADRDHINGTGMDVVKWLEQNSEIQRSAKFIVHSMNPVASRQMCEILRKTHTVIHYPYSLLIENVGPEHRPK